MPGCLEDRDGGALYLYRGWRDELWGRPSPAWLGSSLPGAQATPHVACRRSVPIFAVPSWRGAGRARPQSEPAPQGLQLLPSQQVTKQNLADKIAQLNAAIDDVSSQLNARDASLSKDEAMAQ